MISGVRKQIATRLALKNMCQPQFYSAAGFLSDPGQMPPGVQTEQTDQRARTWQLLQLVLVGELDVIFVCAQPGCQNAVPLDLLVSTLLQLGSHFLRHPNNSRKCTAHKCEDKLKN